MVTPQELAAAAKLRGGAARQDALQRLHQHVAQQQWTPALTQHLGDRPAEGEPPAAASDRASRDDGAFVRVCVRCAAFEKFKHREGLSCWLASICAGDARQAMPQASTSPFNGNTGRYARRSDMQRQ